MTPVLNDPPGDAPSRHRIGGLAAQSGVPIPTIKYWIREGLLPPPSTKTGRTMAYYDDAYLERVRLVRALREQHFLPVRVIREVLADRAEPITLDEAAAIARLGPRLAEKMRLGPAPMSLTRADLLARALVTDADLTLLEELGLIGTGAPATRCYDAEDLGLLDALGRLEQSGLGRDRFPLTSLGLYIELLGELAHREVHMFTRRTMTGLSDDARLALAAEAVRHSEPLVCALRRLLIRRALASDPSATNHEESP